MSNSHLQSQVTNLEKKKSVIKKQTEDSAAKATKQRGTATSLLKEEMVTKLQKTDEKNKSVGSKLDDLEQ